MPLHAEREGLCAANLHCFHSAVGRPAFRRQGIGYARHPLPVQRVYRNRPCAKQIFENTALFEHDVMSGPILNVERIVLLLAMVEAGGVARLRGHFLQVLVERAAIRDVEFLKPAADGKERHGTLDAGADELQRQCVALPVEQHAFTGRCAAVILGMDVRMRAGEEDTVAKRENLLQALFGLAEWLPRNGQ